jgi:hypothetical protein
MASWIISNAERIWSQGLCAVAGETANAIVLILACVVVDCRFGSSAEFWQQNFGGVKRLAFRRSPAYRVPECRCSAPETYLGTRDKKLVP